MADDISHTPTLCTPLFSHRSKIIPALTYRLRVLQRNQLCWTSRGDGQRGAYGSEQQRQHPPTHLSACARGRLALSKRCRTRDNPGVLCADAHTGRGRSGLGGEAARRPRGAGQREIKWGSLKASPSRPNATSPINRKKQRKKKKRCSYMVNLTLPVLKGKLMKTELFVPQGCESEWKNTLPLWCSRQCIFVI